MRDEHINEDSDFKYSPDGKLEYKIVNKKLWYAPEFYSYIKFGMKTKDNDKHWTEDFILDPKKKTLIVYGGDGTTTARAGNGNINASANTLGLTSKQQDDVQTIACYYPKNNEILEGVVYGDIINYGECADNDLQRETLKLLHPFIAKKTEQGWKKLPQNELLENMRNIIITTHCHGAVEMVYFNRILHAEMLTLGYNEDLIDRALRQILCITNNSQRDFDDKMRMTTLHRYSVCNGQGEEMCNYGVKNSYPAHLNESEEFNKLEGNKSAFICLNKNEVMMAFDKILSDSDKSSNKKEHNEAFFTTDSRLLTDVGKKQMKLIQTITQWWYNNHDEVPNAEDLVRQCGQDAGLKAWTAKSFVAGKLLQRYHHNPLQNPHVLTVAKNRFNNPDIEPKHTGIWKLLQDTKQQGS